jgi:hypothetical protein
VLITLRSCTFTFLIGCALLFASPESGAGAASGAATSWPNDGRFLEDQIDITLEVPSGQKFYVATKPGMIMHVAIDVDGNDDLLRKYGVVIHPEIDGKPVKSRSELDSFRNEQLTFAIVVFCIEESRAGDLYYAEPADLELKGGCTPRSKYSQVVNEDIRLFEIEQLIRYDQEVAIELVGIKLRISEYRRQVSKGSRGTGTAAKGCLELGRSEVCSCRVANANGPEVAIGGCRN